MGKIFHLFFILLILTTAKCYIVLPVELLPKENYKSEYDLNSPKDIMSKEFISSYYTELEVGDPSQKIPILIKQKTNDYIITRGQCEKRKPYDEPEKPIAEEVCGSNETISLYNNIDMKQKTNYNNFYFDLAKNSKDNVTGVIGLGLTDLYYHTSFLKVLKSNKLIDGYYWFFEFNSWDSTSGKLILGSLINIQIMI